MSQNKEAYYQGGGGVNEPPKKGKKKYKSDPAIVVQPHFEEPFYRNYDYVSQPGVDGKTSKHGPGTGHNSMQNFKSIKDFLDTRRKKLKGKYKAKDKYIQDDGSITSKASRRMQLLKIIIGSDNNEIDFPIDDQITSIPTGSANLDNIDMVGNMAQIGGKTDYVTQQPDQDGKTPDQLNYERDLIDANNTDDVNDIDDLIDQLLSPKEPPTYGLPDGLEQYEKENEYYSGNQYGITNVGNTTYSNR